MNIKQCPCCGNTNKNTLVPYDKNPTEHKWSYNCFANKSLMECQFCGSYYTSDILSDDELNDFYSSIFSGQELNKFNISSRFEFIPRFFSQMLFLKNHIELFDGMKILEIGPSSSGVLPTVLLFCKPLYYYFEQHEYPAINYYGGIRLGNYYSLENYNKQKIVDKFDLVYMSHSLEHINPSSLNNTIELINSNLNDDGYLFIEVPEQIKGSKMPPHTLFFTLNGLMSLLEGNDFHVTGTQTIKDTLLTNESTNNKRAKKSIIVKFFPWASNKIVGVIFKIPLINKPFRRLWHKIVFKKKVNTLSVPYDGRSYIRIVAKKISSK